MKYLSIDPSGHGKDYTVIIIGEYDEVKNSFNILSLYREQQSDFLNVCNRIISMVEKENIELVIVESNSLGIAYVDYLTKNISIPTLEVSTTFKSKKRMIDLIKYFLGCQKLNLTKVSNSPLIEELKTFQVKNNPNHDDCVMALAVGIFGVLNRG